MEQAPGNGTSSHVSTDISIAKSRDQELLSQTGSIAKAPSNVCNVCRARGHEGL